MSIESWVWGCHVNSFFLLGFVLSVFVASVGSAQPALRTPVQEVTKRVVTVRVEVTLGNETNETQMIVADGESAKLTLNEDSKRRTVKIVPHLRGNAARVDARISETEGGRKGWEHAFQSKELAWEESQTLESKFSNGHPIKVTIQVFEGARPRRPQLR